MADFSLVPVTGGLVVAGLVLLGACARATAPATTGAHATTTVSVLDPDPYDGHIGEVVLTPSQVAYRDALGITDAETHDAFRYSCSLTTVPTTFARYANEPIEPEEAP